MKNAEWLWVFTFLPILWYDELSKYNFPEEKPMSDMIRQELFPGVWLRSIHTDKFKSAYLSVTLMTALEGEKAGVNALVPYVLRRGTAVHPDMESLSAALDELYGGAIEPAVRKKGETQCLGFVASFLDDAYTLNGETILESAANLMGELLLKPLTEKGVFSEAYVEGEKANLIDKIRAQINDKRTYATHRLIREMCSREAYGVDKLGTEEALSAVTPDSLWSAYEELLKNAGVEIYYCGSAEPELVEGALRKAFAALPVNREREEPNCDVRIHAPVEPAVIEEAMDVTQGKLAMGFRTGGVSVWSENFPAMLLCNSVFGGSTLSKLFMNVREKLSLCYYASSMFDRLKGVVLVSSGIEFEKYEQAKSEILAQLEAVKRGELEEWELEGSRRTLMGAYRSMLDEQGSQEEFWLGQSVAGLDFGPGEIADALVDVTAQQVAEMANLLELECVYFLKGKEA